MKKQRHHWVENTVYFILWMTIFIIPIFSHSEDGTVHWNMTEHYWVRMLPFFILFLLNNYLLVPLFLLTKKYIRYLILTLFSVVLLLLVQGLILHYSPWGFKTFQKSEIEKIMEPPGPPEEFNAHTHPEEASSRLHKFPPIPGHGPILKMPVKVGPILNEALVAVFILGFNLAIIFLFKSMRDEEQIKEMENLTLQSELNYLKAQINPHFFMNTLNNIHTLIDIDTEKAKTTVIELSKIMRYILYDADQAKVPAEKEIQLLKNYVELMRIRFMDKVKITSEYPETVLTGKIPPLLLLTLIENAFKHGVSYRAESYIDTSVSTENGYLVYRVANSLHSDNTPKADGVGLDNLRKRLNILYPDRHTLDISENENRYLSVLKIPLES